MAAEYTLENSLVSGVDVYSGHPFGTLVLDAHDYPAMTAEARASARRVIADELARARYMMTMLVASDHPDDKEAVANVTNRFMAFDAKYAPPQFAEMAESGAALDYLSKASDELLLDYLLWTDERTMQVQEAFDGQLDTLKALATAKQREVIDYGLVPEIAVEQLQAVFLQPYTYAVLDTLEAGLGCRHGHYHHTQRVIGLANPFRRGNIEAKISSDGKQTFLHEVIGHAASLNSDAGLVKLLPNQRVPFLSLVLDEPWTEHLAQVALKGRPDVISPAARGENLATAVYAENLRLLELFVGLGGVALSLFGEAATESLYDPHLRARRRLHQLGRTAFQGFFPELRGDSIFYAIAEACYNVPFTRRADVLTRWADKIESRVKGVQIETITQHEPMQPGLLGIIDTARPA